MRFGAILGPFHSAADFDVAVMQQEMQKQALAMQFATLSALAGGDYSSFGGPNPTNQRAAPRRTKCDSCGSREFKEHHGQSVCIYCRSTA